jgi:hypothetical protein
MHHSSSSHASDTDRVADLCDLTRGQDTFAGGEVVLKGVLGVSTAGELGSGANADQIRNIQQQGLTNRRKARSFCQYSG